MKKNDSQLSIAPTTGKKNLSAAQRKFNGLIKKIEEQRQTLQAWETAMPLYVERWHSEFKPLLDVYDGCNLEFLQVLDRLSGQVKLSKTDHRTLTREICEMAESLMGIGDESVKTLHNKYTGRDFDADQREEDELFAQGLEQIFGVDLSEVDVGSPDAIAEKLHEQFRTEQMAHEPKSQKENARQVREEKEAAQASQSVREVYRKLASALHPDRESDPVERERKTALMQRVNHAYSERNLLDLLHLQLEVEHIDANSIATPSNERLKHFNRILSEQLAELLQEKSDHEYTFKHQFNLEPFDTVSPRTLKGKYQHQLNQLTEAIQYTKNLSQELQDPKALKAWLKEQRRLHKAMAWEDDFFAPPDQLFR